MDQAGDLQVIQAEIPLSEAQEYARVLTSLTSGRGSYTLEPSRYEVVPRDVHQTIVGGLQAARRRRLGTPHAIVHARHPPWLSVAIRGEPPDDTSSRRGYRRTLSRRFAPPAPTDR